MKMRSQTLSRICNKQGTDSFHPEWCDVSIILLILGKKESLSGVPQRCEAPPPVPQNMKSDPMIEILQEVLCTRKEEQQGTREKRHFPWGRNNADCFQWTTRAGQPSPGAAPLGTCGMNDGASPAARDSRGDPNQKPQRKGLPAWDSPICTKPDAPPQAVEDSGV